MKKLITILVVILLASCSSTVKTHPDGHPMTIQKAYGLYSKDRITKYKYLLRFDEFYGDNEILFYSDSIYNIGDTIHFVKR